MMLRGTGLVAAVALAVASCGGDVRSTQITPELLENPTALQKVANRLPPEDRQLFGQYIAGRAVANATGLPSYVNEGGKDPRNVAEAIDLMRAAAARSKEIDAIYAERQAKWDEMEKTGDALKAKAEAAGWAPAETDASNEYGEQMMAVQESYTKRAEALRNAPLKPLPKP